MNKSLLFFNVVVSIMLFIEIATAQTPKVHFQPSHHLKSALDSAGSNRKVYEQVLSHYKESGDTLKYKAACFLIENMRYHSFVQNIKPDTALKKIVDIADSMYYALVKGKTYEEINAKPIKDSLKKISLYVRELINRQNFEEVNNDIDSLNKISFDFIVQHIENGFKLRETIDIVQELSFDDFLAYILSFQQSNGKGLRLSGQELNQFFSKYLPKVNANNITEVVRLYGITVSNLQAILGKFPNVERQGFEELFFYKVPEWECFDVTTFGSAVLNAVGIPTSTEFNVAYKMLFGLHSENAVFEKTGHYTTFSLEAKNPYPQQMTERYVKTDNELMNLYRIHYAPQMNSPYFLKTEKEFVPERLSSPLIADVTSLRMATTQLELSFDKVTTNNLAYLATFQSITGIVPVTWGIIDKNNKKVSFKNVIPNRLYFPVYFDGNRMESFGKPFYLKLDSTKKDGNCTIVYYDSKSKSKFKQAIITRKYPRKQKMIKVADNLIGTVVVGFNDSTKIDTLYTLNYSPLPNLQDIDLNNSTAYKNYMIIAPKKYPKMNFSEVEFLSDAKYKYKNVVPPSSLPIFYSKNKLVVDTTLVRIPRGTEKQSKLSKDGSMETAPDHLSFIIMTLKEPQVITKIRFAPLNANNGIVVDNEYQLYYWDKGEWQAFGESTYADFNYLEFKKLPKNRIYWLRNLTGGKEELPFILNKKGKQLFFYADIK